MSAAPKEILYETAFAIARDPEEHGFDRRPEEAFDLGREPVVVNSAYLTGDPEDPPFGQANLLRKDMNAVEEAVVALTANELAVENLSFVPDEAMKGVCKEIREAAEETEPPEKGAFKVVALQAVYDLQGRYFRQVFISNSFVDTLSQRVQVPTLSEEELKLAHAMQAEHDNDIASFEKWAAEIEEARTAAGSVEQQNRVLAENYLNWLVVPWPSMHPVVRSSLFEQVPA